MIAQQSPAITSIGRRGAVLKVVEVREVMRWRIEGIAGGGATGGFLYPPPCVVSVSTYFARRRR
jgi:hypothetical protein